MARVRNVCRMVAVVTLVAAAAAVGNIWSNGGGGGVAPSPALAEDATEAATVRIAAQRVESGRTAFALQVRGEDGWGERIRPRLSSFRRVEDATVGRWANSSLLELESGHTVRISARALEDGRIEFALQEIIDGEPAERIFPRLNKFPANPTVGKWLYSSAIELTGAEPNVDEPPPPTYVPVTRANGWSGQVQYSAWTNADDGTVSTRLLALPHADDESGLAVQFVVACWNGQNPALQIEGLPTMDGTRLQVRLLIDRTEPITELWDIWNGQEDNDADTNVYISSSQLTDPQFRTASGVTIEIGETDPIVVTFGIAGMFDSPVQENLDNCGEYTSGQTRQIEYDYVPWTGEEQFSASVDYRASVSGDGVDTNIWTEVPTEGAVDGKLTFHVSCYREGTLLNVQLLGFPMGEQRPVEVTITFTDGSTHVSKWSVRDWDESNGVHTAPPPDLLARFVESSTATFTIAGVEFSPMTFDLAGMFETPVQENIDNCGMAVRNASRELDLPQSPVVSGSKEAPDGEARIQWWSVPSGNAVGDTFPAELLHADGALQYYLRALCGPGGAAIQVFGSRFGEMTEGDLQVAWSVDGGPEQTETWRVVEFFGRPTAHPVIARDVISAWRDGSTLDLTLLTAEPHTQRFHLAELFSTPIQAQLDECLAMTPPDLDTPAGEIANTQEGNLTYGSSAAFGSTVKFTYMAVQLPSDDTQSGFSTALRLHCGMGGTGITVHGLGQDRPAFIRGYSVEVTWSVDGGPESTSTWDVWPFNVHYYSASPPDDAAFYAAIKDADSLTIKVASDPEFIETYDLAGNDFWETPVQPNLDACIGS